MNIMPKLPTSGPRSLSAAATELWTMLAQVEQWTTLAWDDIRLRYRRTTLGPLWITLGLGASVFSVGILYGVLFGNDLSHYLPNFAAGLIAWTFLSTCLTEGCGAYLGAAALIKAIPVPPAIHVYRMLARQLIMLAHNLLLMVILWLMFLWPIGWATLLVIPGIALNALTALGCMLALSIIAARFRDVQLIVGTLLQLVFLLTPIIWEPKSLRGAALSFLVDYNPIYHLIEVVRQPLLGNEPTLMSWTGASLAAAVSLVLGVTFYARFRHRVAFWV